jgi:hypothetical protein
MQSDDGADSTDKRLHQGMGAAEIKRLKPGPNGGFLQSGQRSDPMSIGLSQLFVDNSLPRSAREHFQEKAAPDPIWGGIRFSVGNAATPRCGAKGRPGSSSPSNRMSIAVNYQAGQENIAPDCLPWAGRIVRVAIVDDMAVDETI